MNLSISRKRAATIAWTAAIALTLIWSWTLAQDYTVARQLFWTNVAIQVLYVSSVAYLYRTVGAGSFGQAIFYGGAAYGVALLDDHISNSAMLLLMGCLIGLVLAAFVGLFIFRVTGLRFSILTLALGQALFLYANTEQWTGGETGLYGVRRNSVLGFSITKGNAYLVVVVVIMILGILAILWLERSRHGVVLHAMRSSEPRASALGYSVNGYRYVGFIISGTIAGLCGAMHAQLWGLVSTDLLHWKTSGDPILMTLIGGMHSVIGPVIGAVGYLLMVDKFSAWTSSWLLWVGAILLVVVLAAPTGLVGAAQKIRAFASRPGRRTDAVEATH